MSAPLQDLVTLDRLVHAPARFAILTALSACGKADFQGLQSITGLAQGNLSRHLQKLEERDLITIDKRFKGKRPQTWLELTPAGRAAFQEHRRRLNISVTTAKGWPASPSPPAVDSLRDVRRLAQERLIDAALERHVGNRRRAAAELGISLSTLHRTLRRRGRHPPSDTASV